MSEAVDFVAENIMKFKKKFCAGSTITLSVDGNLVETFLKCDSCGFVYSEDILPNPCPIAFPSFTFIDLMKKLGEKGFCVELICQSVCKEKPFVVKVDTVPLPHTDNPLETLCDYLCTMETSHGGL